MKVSRVLLSVIALLLWSGCDEESLYGDLGDEDPIFEADPETLGAADRWSGSTVGDLMRARSCSTEPTMPLNAQIAEQMNCIEPSFFVSIDDIPNISLGGGANPFLQRPAAEALRRVAASNSSATLSISSAWRSVAQQAILKSWQGSCGIGIAANPGSSNHESGLAVDLPSSSRSTFHSALQNNGYSWYCSERNGGREAGCRDAVHYTYRAGGEDLRTRSVLAFQQLWNNAHPEDRIPEDGQYGTATATRLSRTPLSGFPSGPTCSASLTDDDPQHPVDEEDWEAWATPCTAYGVDGYCVDVRECDSSTHEAISGYCDGGWSIQCCIPIDGGEEEEEEEKEEEEEEEDIVTCEAYGVEGLCIDLNECPSSTHESIMGYCPGTFNIQCCIPR